MEILQQEKPRLEWLNNFKPSGNKKAALLIPQFNEGSRCNMFDRLEYFMSVTRDHSDIIDVIIIDDGSTDNSLDLIREFIRLRQGAFYVSSVYPNARKVGALYLTTLAIQYEFVILSDFDTDLVYLNKLTEVLYVLSKDDSLMGCYFRMLPNYGSGMAFRFQKLEYSLARSLYRLMVTEGSVPVMPGAGSCYKRDILLSIYSLHSGRWWGEDREATLIGLKLGYKAVYVNRILALTRPPMAFSELVKQRVRWYRGYLETVFKEREFYLFQIRKWNGIGIRTLIDAITVFFIIFLPLMILMVSVINPQLLILFIISCYLASVTWCVCLICSSPKESEEFKKGRLLFIIYYPFVKIALDYLAWTKVFFIFLRQITMRKP